MSESVLKSILEESARLEWVKYEHAQEHVFSKKHERKMKHVFKLFERNDCKLKPYIGSRPHYHFRFTKRNKIFNITYNSIIGCYFLGSSCGVWRHIFYFKEFLWKSKR